MKNGFPVHPQSILFILHSILLTSKTVCALIDLAPRNAKINLVQYNLGKLLVLEIMHHFQCPPQSIDTLLCKNSSVWHVSPRLKLFAWSPFNPVVVEAGQLVLWETDLFGGIELYLLRPIEVVNALSQLVVSLLFHQKQHPLKIRNCYAKGDHAALIVRTVQDKLVPQHVSLEMNSLETEYYCEKLLGNVDLVVLERAADYLPVVLEQTTYHGVLDDFFGINHDQLNTKPFAEVVDPTLCTDLLYETQLKHLNFAGIGPILNKMAKHVQSQFLDASSNAEPMLDDIQKMVADLGELTSQQQSVKRHTTISARIVLDIDAEYRLVLQFENTLWERAYRDQMAQIMQFVARGYECSRVLAAIVCVSCCNDGIRLADYEALLLLIHDAYGLDALFWVQLLCKLHLIKVLEKNDFFSSLIPQGAVPVQPSNLQQENTMTGILGNIDFCRSKYTLLDKFWNLHPGHLESDELVTEQTHSVYNTLPGNTVPLLCRLVEALYFRGFLTYKPINNVKRRPNWLNLGLEQMFAGETLDINVDDRRDSSRRGDATGPQLLEYLIVVVAGGITRSELSCFKLLEQRLREGKQHRKVWIVSNGILNHNKFFSFLKDERSTMLVT